MNKAVLPPDFAFRLKAATRDLIKRAGGVERAGELVSMGKSQVDRWGSLAPENMGKFIPIYAALLLEQETSCALVTRLMADISGLKVEEAQPGEARRDNMMKALAHVAAVSAQFTSAVAASQSDNKTSINEHLEISQLGNALTEAITEIERIAATDAASTVREEP